MAMVQVNTRKKAEKIIEALKRQGRVAFYEEFFTFEGRTYDIFYKAVLNRRSNVANTGDKPV